MMRVDLSFNEIRKFIEDDSSQLIDDFNSFSNLVLIFSPLLLTSSIGGLAPTINIIADFLGVKNEIAQSGKKLIQKIKGKEDKNSLTRLRRMETVYWLITYTAFFEAIDEMFPQLSQSVGLTSKEKLKLSESAITRLQGNGTHSLQTPPVLVDSGLLEFQLHLPHPVDSFDNQKKQLIPLYEELTKGFLAFLECLAVWDSANDRQKTEIKKASSSLPESSFNFFKGQYYQLATEFEEFYIWSNLHEHEETKSGIERMSKFMQRHAALTEASQNTIDVGFRQLAEAVQLIPHEIVSKQANSVIAELEKFYSYTLDEPIIKDSSSIEDEKPTLTYPKKSDIFIPQPFKVIRYKGKEHLENEVMWKQVPVRNDIAAFLLSYFSSPYSALAPLIILGHPGSGKSLLTSILAARMVSPAFTPIRVELRNINADSEISVQIEEQIRKNTARRTSWADLADHFEDRPALIILDGYDELLQASGKVFSGYLQKVQKFQENELSLGRKPVRVIVTSRITLIDNAVIPTGVTVIRLLEFDETKRNMWISVWNANNRQYFQQTSSEPFQLPEDNGKILALAEQPLLLLMLALYDSEGNQLRKKQGLDQTILYSSLLRRFIERERTKDENFKSLKSAERTTEIEKDLERLGVAAIGMFNRRSLYIKSSQLSADLSFYQLERQIQETGGRMLSQADLLLGSFFFVQESKSTYKDDSNQKRGMDTAFEFLHNTFGEFLTADFILRKILSETQRIYKLRQDEDLRTTLEHILTDANGFPKEWFTCLMYTPLFSRPVILDMMREWLKHNLKSKKRKSKDFLDDLDTIVSNQIKRLLNSNALPSIMTEKGSLSFEDLPTMGYAAIYSLNLIVLRTVLSSEPYVFDEQAIFPYEDGARAWDRLTHLWRSWFSLESLSGLTTVLIAKRQKTKIHIEVKESFSTSLNNNRLTSILDISRTLADNITSGMSSILLYNSFGSNSVSLSDIGAMLRAENIDLDVELMTRHLREFHLKEYDYATAMSLLNESILLLERQYDSRSDTVTLLMLECVKVAKLVGGSILIREIYERFVRPQDPGRWPMASAGEMIRLARQVGDIRYLEHFYDEFTIRRFNKDQPVHQLIDQLPTELTIEVLKLARDFNDKPFLENFYHHFLNRIHSEELPVGLAVEVIRLAREFHDRHFLQRFYQPYFSNVYSRGIFRRYHSYELPSELTIEVLKLAWELNDKPFLENFYHRFLNRIHPGELPVELAVEVIRLARNFHDRRFLQHFYDEYRNRTYMRNHREMIFLGGIPQLLIIEMLKLAKELNDQQFIEHFYEYFKNRSKLEIGSLPIDVLNDIRWVAKEFGDDELLKEISKRIRLRPK